MRKLPWIGVGVVGALLFSPHVRAESGTGGLSIEPYRLSTYDGRQHEAELGRLWVPENRSKPSSRLIQVAFVRLKSRSTNPGPPIIWLAGGPGVPGVGMARVPVYFALFDQLREVSDVILLDQRGLGLSSPNLECAPTPTPANVFETERSWLRTYTRKSLDCTRVWRSRGADVAGYTNDASADDIDDLRQALGAAKVSLLGHSYGTALALATIRRHEQRIDRVALAGVVGPDNLLAAPAEWDELLNKISAVAAQPAAPAAPYAELGSLFEQAQAKLERRPVVVSVKDKLSGATRDIRIGKIGLQWLVRRRMSDARNYAGLPALLTTVIRGDHTLLAPQMDDLHNGFQGRSPMANGVDCSLGWSKARELSLVRQTPGALFSNVNLQWRSNICEAMGVSRGDPSALPRPAAATPALFLSGGLDTNTPPFQAEYVRWGFPNSTHVVIENSGHEMLPDRRVRALVVEFFGGAVASREVIQFPPPRFLSIEEAKAAGGLQRSHL